MGRLAAMTAHFHFATQEALVATAKREHAKVMAAEPQPMSFTRSVDGRKNAPEEDVREDGRIIYTYDRVDMVVAYALNVLRDLSPVLSGEYRKGHRLFVGGKPAASLKGWAGEEIMISNTLPYTRKIEIGAMKMRVPGTSHVYGQAAALVEARFANLALILFEYRGIVGGLLNNAVAGNRRQDRFPALVIRSY